MKELTIEEKAKAYDEALERAKTKLTNEVASDIFPELKESEDERIRKAIIKHFKTGTEYVSFSGFSKGEIINWLEKEGEQLQGKSALEAAKEEKVDNQNCVKPVDKIEPKFRKGDWVIFNENHNSVYQVERIDNYRYYLRHYLGGTLSVHFDDELIRPWTINDAKPGDVLHCWIDGDEFVLIYKGVKDGYITTYGHLYQKLESFSEEPTTMFCRTIQGHFTPATKEQRDQLEKSMADAGYTFDFENKELKKIENEIEIPFGAKDSELQEAIYYIPKGFHAEIEGNNVVIKKGEQKPAWSQEDECTLKGILADHPMCMTYKNWLKSIKNRIHSQPMQEWSEEDEETLKDIITSITNLKDSATSDVLRDIYNSKIDWLKSLKDRYTWKPSDEQFKVLNEVLNFAANHESPHWNDYIFGTLHNLIIQLKKLREE